MSRNFGDAVRFERLHGGIPEIDDGTESDAEVFEKADKELVNKIVLATDELVAMMRKHMKKEKPMTPYQLFREKFNLPFNKYIDAELSVLLGKPVLDLYKFDDWLHERYGNYEEAGHSTYTLLTEHYGQETADQIRELAMP